MSISKTFLGFFLFPMLVWSQGGKIDSSIPENPTEIFSKLFSEEKVIGGSAGIMVDGEIVWQKALGFADERSEAHFKMETKVRTASLAKPMTAVAVLQLYEKGLLDLDASIQTYVPDFPEKPEGTITVRHLLNHNSGIKGYKNAKEAETQKEYPTLKDAVDLFKDRELAGTPGQVFEYSSYGYVVLGRIIENVSGMSYEAYMQQNIWNKCGMNSTGIERYGVEYPEKSTAYHRSRNGKIKVASKINNLSNRIPGGGFYSTTGDVLKFGNAILKDELITAETKAMMFVAPAVTNDGNPYGMGWYLYGINPKYGNVVGHTGEQTGTSSQLMLLPDMNAVIVIMTNTSGALSDVFYTSVFLFQNTKLSKEAP